MKENIWEFHIKKIFVGITLIFISYLTLTYAMRSRVNALLDTLEFFLRLSRFTITLILLAFLFLVILDVVYDGFVWKRLKVRINPALRKELTKRRLATENEIGDSIQNLKSTKRHIRGSALSTLSESGKIAVEPLINAMNDDISSVRAGAAFALGEIGDTRAEGPLIEALKDEIGMVKADAAVALGKIGGVKAVAPLEEALKDEEEFVRESVGMAINRIHERLKKELESAEQN